MFPKSVKQYPYHYRIVPGSSNIFFKMTTFDLMTHNLYFTILVEIFIDQISAENIFQKPYRVNRTQY